MKNLINNTVNKAQDVLIAVDNKVQGVKEYFFGKFQEDLSSFFFMAMWGTIIGSLYNMGFGFYAFALLLFAIPHVISIFAMVYRMAFNSYKVTAFVVGGILAFYTIAHMQVKATVLYFAS